MVLRTPWGSQRFSSGTWPLSRRGNRSPHFWKPPPRECKLLSPGVGKGLTKGMSPSNAPLSPGLHKPKEMQAIGVPLRKNTQDTSPKVTPCSTYLVQQDLFSNPQVRKVIWRRREPPQQAGHFPPWWQSQDLWDLALPPPPSPRRTDSVCSRSHF